MWLVKMFYVIVYVLVNNICVNDFLIFKIVNVVNNMRKIFYCIFYIVVFIFVWKWVCRLFIFRNMYVFGYIFMLSGGIVYLFLFYCFVYVFVCVYVV